MAQSHTTWSIRGRRELLSWDGSNSSSSTNHPSNSPTDRPTTPLNTDVSHAADENCSWCGQTELGENSVRGHVETQGSGSAKVFCSDICFSQCRRAAFKRAKVCDWCKHIRHTVTYVDLHDGQRQLQFCTDKCRNQYKMHLFCAEATSLGVQSFTTPVGMKADTSSTTSIDHKIQSTDLLITPDLWLSDCRLETPTNFKMECNEETELTSIDSDQDEQGSETPLNLVHSSRRNGNSEKRKSSSAEICEPLSKKGKSHRKTQSTIHKIPIQTRSVIPQVPDPTFSSSTWPSFHYTSNVVHPQFLLPSQILSLNHAFKPLKKSTLTDCVQEQSESEKNICKAKVIDQSIANDKDLCHNSKVIEKGESIKITDENPLPMYPSNFTVLRIPYFIPFPVPVPIPIPLNIHEKYLKHVLT